MRSRDDPKDAIYHIILEHMKRHGVDEVRPHGRFATSRGCSGRSSVGTQAKLSEIEPLVLAKGYTDDQCKECIRCAPRDLSACACAYTAVPAAASTRTSTSGSATRAKFGCSISLARSSRTLRVAKS